MEGDRRIELGGINNTEIICVGDNHTLASSRLSVY